MQEFHPQDDLTPQSAPLAVAQTSLATEPDAETQAARFVAERFRDITQRAKSARRRLLIGNSIVFATLFLWARVEGVGPEGVGGAIAFFIGALFAYMYLTMIPNILLWTRTTPEFDAVELARLGGTQAIAPLFTILTQSTAKEQNQTIYAALARLLPQMKASDALLLDSAARRTIHKWLNTTSGMSASSTYPAELRVAALKALEQVGDSRDIPAVTRLTKLRCLSGRKAKIRQAAKDCLPMLLMNCGEVDAARTFLRASQAEDAGADTLLRPASHSGQTDAAELLRGSDSPDAPPPEGEQK